MQHLRALDASSFCNCPGSSDQILQNSLRFCFDEAIEILGRKALKQFHSFLELTKCFRIRCRVSLPEQSHRAVDALGLQLPNCALVLEDLFEVAHVRTPF